MSDRIPEYGNFDIPNELIELHEWICDEFIDGPFGHISTLVYPPKKTECPNCKISPSTGRSSNIYKSGGPQPFTNHTTCPWCGGVGRQSLAQTDSIRLRTYWNPKDWTKFGIKVENPEGLVMVIGYMDDYPKLERAKEVVIDSNIAGIRRLTCKRSGEMKPWGFRQARYFVQMMDRQGR